MLEDLNEKLITHHVGGAWRAPFSGRMRNLRAPGGGPVIAALAEADAQDIARALRSTMAGAEALSGMGQAARDRLAADFLSELRARAALVAAARALERGADAAAAEAEVAQMLCAMESALSCHLHDLSGTAGRPTLILGTAAGPLEALGAALMQRLRAGNAVILKPAPRAPVVPLALMDALSAAGLPPGAAALLQGGGAVTGAPLLAHPLLARAVLAGKAQARAALAAAARAGSVRLECRVAPSAAGGCPG